MAKQLTNDSRKVGRAGGGQGNLSSGPWRLLWLGVRHPHRVVLEHGIPVGGSVLGGLDPP